MVRPVIRVPAYEADDGFTRTVSFGAARTTSDPSAAVSGNGAAKKAAFSKVPSLLFELEDLEDGAALHKPCADQLTDPSVSSVLGSLSSLLQPWSEPEYMVSWCLH